MELFTPIDPDQVPNAFSGGRGRWAYPFLKAYLEAGEAVVKINRNHPMIGGRSTMNITTGLKNYIDKHKLPIKTFQRDGEPYLARTDMKEDGSLPDLNVEETMSYVPPAEELPEHAPVLTSKNFDEVP